jgi:TolB-like protein/Tfp pilus assembly protein PilF
VPGAAAHVVARAKNTTAEKWRKTAVGVAAVVVVGLGATAVWTFVLRPARPAIEPASVERMAFPLPDRPSIAVLPFANLSADPQQEYFADGMTDDLITDLSKISALFVIARNSAFTYKGRAVKPRQVAEELGVRYVVEGSVRRAGDRLRINAQLIDALTGGHLWAERYDGNLDDVFALQDQINRRIVTALAIHLTPSEEQEIHQSETDNVAAYDAFLKGWDHEKRWTCEGFAQALPHLENAIELDPDYGRALAALAMAYYYASRRGCQDALNVSYFEGFKRARQLHERARETPSYFTHLVSAVMNRELRLHDQAIAESEHGMKLAPNDPDAFVNLSNALAWAVRPTEAIECARKAMRRDPRWRSIALAALGLGHFCLGQFEEAAGSWEEGLRLEPEHYWTSLLLTSAYAHLGRDQEARAALENCRENNRWKWPKDLRSAMGWPIKYSVCSDRLAEGLLKAGLPGEPGGYYKFLEENRLTGNEIRDLVSGRRMWIENWGERWRIDCAETGELKSISDRGQWWIERELLCLQWNDRYEDYPFCGTVFRNPDGTKGVDEYLKQNHTGVAVFAVED